MGGYYQEFYSRENVVTEKAIAGVPPLPTMEELDTVPTIDELKKTINSLASDKAPGRDGIPPEVVKVGNKNLFLTTFTTFWSSAGNRAPCHGTCAMRRSSH